MRLTLPSLALGLLLCQGAFAGDGTAAIGGGLGVFWATLLVNSSAARPAQPSVPALAAQPAALSVRARATVPKPPLAVAWARLAARCWAAQ